MVSQALAELRLRNSSNLVMADTFTEVHRKDGLVCAVGDAAAVSVECAGVDGLEVCRATERGADRDGNGILYLGMDHILCVAAAPAAWRHGL